MNGVNSHPPFFNYQVSARVTSLRLFIFFNVWFEYPDEKSQFTPAFNVLIRSKFLPLFLETN